MSGPLAIFTYLRLIWQFLSLLWTLGRDGEQAMEQQAGEGQEVQPRDRSRQPLGMTMRGPTKSVCPLSLEESFVQLAPG